MEKTTKINNMSSKKANHLQQEIRNIFHDVKFNKSQIVFKESSIKTEEQIVLSKEINRQIAHYLMPGYEGGYSNYMSKERIKMLIRKFIKEGKMYANFEIIEVE